MAKLTELIEYIDSRFRTRNLEKYKEESGITYDAGKDIKKIGYATNITPEVVNSAKEQNVDLIMTHHNAWDFIYGLKEECIRLLEIYGISHYFNHLPLDDSEFGTNSSLAKALELEEIKKTFDVDGFMCGVVAKPKDGVAFGDFVKMTEQKIGEKVQAWKFNDRPINKVYIICGAGHVTPCLKEAVDEECDLYITGERILYTIEYAKLHNLNLIIGSHTFTELFGVKGMVDLVLEKFNDMQIELIEEERIESCVL